MKQRFNPDAIPEQQPTLAHPTMERGQHYLIHSRNGDIWGQYSGPATDPAATLVGNILIVAHLEKKKAAEPLCEALQQAGLARAAVLPWQKALANGKTRSMWAVVLQNATLVDVALATPFIPVAPVAGPKKVAAKNHVSLTGFPRKSPHGAAARDERHVADRVLAMPVAMFAFLLESDDLAAAAAKRDAFAAHLRGGSATADWRREWSAWIATPAPAAPVPFTATTASYLEQLSTLTL